MIILLQFKKYNSIALGCQIFTSRSQTSGITRLGFLLY